MVQQITAKWCIWQGVAGVGGGVGARRVRPYLLQGSAGMASGELASVIAGTREDWPGGARTLTPRESTRDRTGTLGFRAELDPDGDQVWFRTDEDAVGPMPAETPADRGRRLVDVLIVLITSDRQLGARHQPLRGPEFAAGDGWLERLGWRRWIPSRPTRPAGAELERPPATTRHLAEASTNPNTRRAYSGALRRLRRSARRPAARGRHPLPPILAELHDQGRQPRARPGNGRRGLLAGYRRPAGDRGRGQARPFVAADLAAVLATSHRPTTSRPRQRVRVGRPRARPTRRRDRPGSSSWSGMRRNEVSALGRRR